MYYKKYKKIFINIILYVNLLLLFLIIFFYIIEKTVRKYELAHFLPKGQNWLQLQLNSTQLKEIFKINNDNISQEGNEKISTNTQYNSYLNYVTVDHENEIYYRPDNKILENCIKESKIYLFGGSLVAGFSVPNDNDILSNKLTINSNKKNNNCYKYFNRGQDGHNFEQIFDNIISYHYNLDGDIIVIFGINSFVNNIYSNQSHMLDKKFIKNQNYLLIDNFGERVKIFFREFLSRLHSLTFINQFIKNDFKRIDPLDYMIKHSEIDKDTISQRIQASCDRISEKAFLLKKFTNEKNKKIIFFKQPIVSSLNKMNKFEVEIEGKMKHFLFFMSDIEEMVSYFASSYFLFLNECEKKFNEKELNLINLDLKKTNNKITYFVDYIHMTPSGLEQLSMDIIENLYKSNFLEKL